MDSVITAILTGGVTVAVIEGIREALKWRRERKAKKEDQATAKAEYKEQQADLKIEERLEKIEDQTAAQNTAIKYILYDRIRYIGQEYIADKEVDFDDRRILNDMHQSYHFGLSGNGDLDTLMDEVNRLPLKKR